MKVNFFSKYKKYKGIENMEIDISMLDSAIKSGENELFVRFYGWEPRCVSLGRNQKDFVPDAKIDIVRRPTGGRALLHDKEITYAVSGKIPDGYGVLQTYKKVSDILIKGFMHLGIELAYAGEFSADKRYCMNISAGCDICYKGKKFIGSAQYRKNGYFLQHGSILRDIDKKFFETVFSEPVNREKIATLNEISPNLTDEDVIHALSFEFERFS